MASSPRNVIDTRYEQMFPRLDPAEIDRVRRFGEPRTYGAGERLVASGEVSPGMFVFVSGEVAVTQHSVLGRDQPIVTHGPGSFMGELAQLSGQPSLVEAHATKPVDALVIPSHRLREVLVAEAELGERIMRALILRRVGLLESGIGGPVIVGRADHAGVLRLAGFLTRNGHPHQRLDPDSDPSAKTLVERFRVEASELPIVLCPNGRLLRNPSEVELASCLGLVQPIDPTRLYDVAIVGAGPAGLAAAVYGASEGLSIIVLDARAFGGQAGASARIENYLGFPTGITGMALMARAFNQAQKFGAEMAIPDEVASLDCNPEGGGARVQVCLANGERLRARALVIASGARYRRLEVENLAAFEGSGVHYWASPLEAQLCAGQEVALVGAGNSAGQAVVYLASKVAKVWLLVRGASLEASMSRYLVDRIAALPNVELHVGTEIVGLEGDARNGLHTALFRHRASGTTHGCALRHLFLFIGADPNAAWLEDCVAVDHKGFIVTGRDCPHFVDAAHRAALPLETSMPGVFAIGDVRAGSTKRVAAAVGEGAAVVAQIHSVLAFERERA
jgi:thioredoxin reductase (NADPH)